MTSLLSNLPETRRSSFSFECRINNTLCHCLILFSEIVSVAWVMTNIPLLLTDQFQSQQPFAHFYLDCPSYQKCTSASLLIDDRLCGNRCLAPTSFGLTGKAEPVCTSIASTCSVNFQLFMVNINSIHHHEIREEIPLVKNLIQIN